MIGYPEDPSADAAMTAIVQAGSAAEAIAFCGMLPRDVLRELADLLYLDEGGSRPTLTARIVAEARA